MFLDLSNVPDFVSEFKLAHVMCPRATAVCFRLGVRGYPTISVLRGSHIYDYQGFLTVEGLSSFILQEEFLSKSKARLISHVTSPAENFLNHISLVNLKLRKMTMIIFAAVGLGHLEEEFAVQVVYVCALTPFLLFLIALVVDNRMAAGKRA